MLSDRPRTASRSTLQLHISETGLVLNGGTCLIRMSTGAFGERLAIEQDAERLLALIAIAYRGLPPTDLGPYVEAAAAYWLRGEKALANIRLVYAGLPDVHDPTLIPRVQLAEYCLDNGMTPSALMEELGFEWRKRAYSKFDPEQPRVPAGSGPESGRWVSQLLGFASKVSFLARVAPSILRSLAAFASRFSAPTAVLGALFIPASNSGGVTRGTLPGAPDIDFEKDGPAGRLRLSKTGADGSTIEVEAQLRAGVYVDVATGAPIGRDLDGQLYLDLDSVRRAIADADTQNARGEPEEKPKAEADEPKLCPAPTLDTAHGASPRAIAYEDQVHARVNPLAPIPSGFGIMVIDPLTGRFVFPDDCFRYAGDLVDGDMHVGDLVDAKGPGKQFLYERGWSIDDDVEQAKKELRAAKARGVGLKLYFAEEGAADIMRARLKKEGLSEIVVGYMPAR